MSKLAYLLLFKWFEEKTCFPEDVRTFPSGLIEHGIVLLEEQIFYDDLLKFFEQNRTINRYKKDIREYFEFTLFDKSCPLLRNFLIANVFKEKNEEILKHKFFKYLKKAKIEIPAASNLLEVINKAKTDKEQQIFSQIDNLLSKKDKNYIDGYLLSGNDFEGVCQFLQQDSGSSSRNGVSEEIKRLEILNRLPIESLDFLDSIYKCKTT